MSGAIAGTAILKSSVPTKKLKIITLTVNNSCNLNCPHCYLQYERENYTIKEPTINAVFQSDFEHLAIVGKEPFLNENSVSLIEGIIERCYLNKKTVSVITNGIGLKKLKLDTAKFLDYIDISFDGGPRTYQQYRKGSFEKIIEIISLLKEKTSIKINALHTLSTGNIDNIEDMINIKKYANFDIIMFSPFLETLHFGKNSVTLVSLKEIMKKLSNSPNFIMTKEVILLIDIYHLLQESISFRDIKNAISEYKLESRVILFEKDPLNYGIIRVTYDDYVLTPYESINPKSYKHSKFNASNQNLNKVFFEMCNNNLLNSHDN